MPEYHVEVTLEVTATYVVEADDEGEAWDTASVEAISDVSMHVGNRGLTYTQIQDVHVLTEEDR